MFVKHIEYLGVKSTGKYGVFYMYLDVKDVAYFIISQNWATVVYINNLQK